MDEIDLSLLRELRQDARCSLKELGERIGLSLSSTRERLRKLEQRGVIRGYAALLDHEQMGLHYCCFCLLILRDSGAHRDDEFLTFIEGSKDILECHRITGAHEYLLKIVTRSPKTLEHTLADLRNHWGVVRSNTYTVLSTLKEVPSAEP